MRTATQRKEIGAYYTPVDVVDGLLDIALEPIIERAFAVGYDSLAAIRIVDPSCGDGAFLVRAMERVARRLSALDTKSARNAAADAARCVVGVDSDPQAVTDARRRLAEASAINVTVFERQIVTADALLMAPPSVPSLFDGSDALTWPRLQAETGADDGFDLVIGNPPFLSQTLSGTRRSDAYQDELVNRFGSAAGRRADTGAIFWALALQIVKPQGGTTCLIEPVAALTSTSSAPLRSLILDRAAVSAVWVSTSRVFDAGVDVCAPVFSCGADAPDTQLFAGSDFNSLGLRPPVTNADRTWSRFIADAQGVPDLPLTTSGCVEDVASVHADFRDEYYGLRNCILEMSDADDARFPKLITTGLVDSACVRWGTRACRIHGTDFQFPRVDRTALPEPMQAWARRRLVPKVIVASQTKVIEALVDEDGSLLPSVPLISVVADGNDLWKIAALLNSPPALMIAARRHLGGALGAHGIKMSASDVGRIPLPYDHEVWGCAAATMRAAATAGDDVSRLALLEESAMQMCDAFRIRDTESLVHWWRSRCTTPDSV